MIDVVAVRGGSDGNLQVPAAVQANITSGEDLCKETTQSKGNGPAIPAFNYASTVQQGQRN